MKAVQKLFYGLTAFFLTVAAANAVPKAASTDQKKAPIFPTEAVLVAPLVLFDEKKKDPSRDGDSDAKKKPDQPRPSKKSFDAAVRQHVNQAQTRLKQRAYINKKTKAPFQSLARR